MQRDYLYFITFLLSVAGIIVFRIWHQFPNEGSTPGLAWAIGAIGTALLVLWNYNSKMNKITKERQEAMSKGRIVFDLSKSYTNSKISYIVKYNDGSGDEISMGTLGHIANVIKKVSMHRSYTTNISIIKSPSMHSVDAFAESNFFTQSEVDKLNSLLLKPS